MRSGPREYPWSRLWRAVERPLHTDADGFLEVREGAERPVGLHAITASCALLLGESGVGKSTALHTERRRLRAEGAAVRWFDLSGRHDEAALRADLRATLAQHREGSLHLFFDSLDEAPSELARFDALLAEELEHAYRILPQLRLRVACRTGALPPRLVESLGRIWEANVVECYEIAPLTQADVLTALAARSTSAPEATLARWREAKLGPLATRPMTLELLLDVVSASDAALPSMSATDLYRRAIDHMLRHVDAHAHRAALRRLAAVTILGEKIHIRAHERGALRDAWTLDDLVGGEEPCEGRGATAIDHALLQAVCTGPLFSGPEEAGDGSQVTWRHRSFAEFLCAEWLMTHHPGDAALRWVERSILEERQVVPSLEGVAVWAANLDEGARAALTVDAPHLLPHLDTARLDWSTRERMVEAFLLHLNAGPSPAWWQLRGTNLAAFEHPNLDAQLRRWITDSSRRDAARVPCIWTASRGQRTATLPALFEVASNTREPTSIRKEAVAAIREILPARDPGLKQLLPLLSERLREDRGEDLRGNVLRACWPWCFANAEDAFAVLESPREETTYGVYGWFLDHELAHLLPPAWLPDALAWTRDRTSRPMGWGHGDVRKEIVRRAWERLDEPAVVEGLVAVRVAALHEHDDLKLPVDLRAAEHSATRIMLTERTLRATASSASRGPIDALVDAWLVAQDFDGLIDRAVAEEDPDLSARLLELALRLYEVSSRPAEQTERLWALSVTDRFTPRLEALCRAWEIDDPNVQWMRRKPPAVLPGKPPAGVVTEGQRRRILAELERTEHDDPERWWQLHTWVCARPTSEDTCRLTQDFRIDDTPFWKSADDPLKQRLVDAALRYVEVCTPDTEEWFGRGIWHRPALAGRAALTLLHQHAPEPLGRLSSARWALWAPALLDPAWMSDDQCGAVWPAVVQRAHQHAPDVVRQSVLSLLDLENARRENTLVLPALETIRDPTLARALLDRLRRRDVRPNIFRDVLDVVGRTSPDDAAGFCAEFVADGWGSGDLEAACAVFAAAWLLRERSDMAWVLLERPFHHAPTLGGEVIAVDAWRRAFEWSPAMTVPAHLAGYYRWAKHYLRALAPDTRNSIERGGVVEAPHHVFYSVAPTLRRLCDLGTAEALAELEALHREDPADDALRGEWYRARRLNAERAWRPWSLDELLHGALPRRLRRTLREALMAHYGDPARARIVSADAGLPVERIDWQGGAEVVWERVLDVAIVSGRLDALLERCCEDYPALAPLRAEVHAQRAS